MKKNKNFVSMFFNRKILYWPIGGLVYFLFFILYLLDFLPDFFWFLLIPFFGIIFIFSQVHTFFIFVFFLLLYLVGLTYYHTESKYAKKLIILFVIIFVIITTFLGLNNLPLG